MGTENPFSNQFGSGLYAPFSSLGGTSSPATLSLLGSVQTSPPAPPHMWFYVRRRFNGLLSNITITDIQRNDGETKQAGVRKALNKYYWGVDSETANSLLIGSWGKDTRVRPSRDIDILFLLPGAVYHQYQARTGNRQSALLQDVKEVLRTTYSQTAKLRADGQVVLLPFNTTPIEVAVGFRCNDGSIIYCDTNNGGSYKTSTAEYEADQLQASDQAWGGNTRALARMMKQWQRHCDVPIKSFQLERLAIEFLSTWAFNRQDVFFYDWMIRDFLGFLTTKANTTLYMPGTYEQVPLGEDWIHKARKASAKAVSAADYERDNKESLAYLDWQEIFGNVVPQLS